MKKLHFLFFLTLLCFPVATFAADIFFDANGNQFGKGEEFVISVLLDTKGQSLNAVEGSVNFPSDIVDIKEIRDGDSVINLWVERPHIYKEGSIKFSGITPGGFSGSHNTLFSVVLRATNIGNGAIYGSELRSLLNNGAGANIQVKNQSLPIIIGQNITDIVINDISLQDEELPESFTPIIDRDPNIFNGKYFLVFATQDKISGIGSYEVREGEWGWFTTVESPYLLNHQSLDRKIFVKVIDKAGNERTETVEPKNEPALYHNYIIFVILALVIIVFLFKKIWKKSLR